MVDRVLAALRRWQVRSHVPAGGVVVDLGCGFNGDLLVRLAARIREGIGFDISVNAVPPAANVRLHRAAADAPLPLEDSSVDLVTCLAVIEHVARPQVLLAEAHRVLRPGGALVVTTPAAAAKPILELISHRLQLIDPTEIDDHERYYSSASLRAELEQAGFPPAGIRVRRFELGLNLAAVARA
jgi:ubiquinone/menaquinone biosynthesis C-methylase UbiE